jgi:hypothetical protein
MSVSVSYDHLKMKLVLMVCRYLLGTKLQGPSRNQDKVVRRPSFQLVVNRRLV